MRSEIKIDYIDRGIGKGIEPVIRVEIRKSEDPRDKLISSLFQSIEGEENYLQFSYFNQKHVTTSEGYPDLEKQVLLFKPDLYREEAKSQWVEKVTRDILEIKKMIADGRTSEIVPYIVSESGVDELLKERVLDAIKDTELV